MLILTLFRHAKSSWANPELDDFERPLNERGTTAAPLMGKVISKLEPPPDLVLCSSSVRTRQTLALAEETCGSLADRTKFEDDLYLATPRAMVSRLQKIPENVRHVMLVGHNPGMQMLASELIHTGEARAIVRLEDKFPTGAIAVFSFPHTRWSELAYHTGRLEQFTTPRECA